MIMSLFAKSRGHLARACFAAAVLVIAVLWPTLASAAHTSLVCPAKSGTVSNGGTVSIDVTDCTPLGIGFAGTGPVDGPALPAHGSANLRITGSNWFVDYSHNGDSATSDFFEFTDASGNGGGQETVRVTITITPPASPITVSPASLPTMTAGTSFSQNLTSTGGVAPYTYTLQSGVLPVGLTLSSGGVLSGTPTQRGGYTFSVRATDSTSPTAQFVDKGYTGTVQNPTLSLATPSGTAIQGVTFSQTLSASGGVAPYTYQLETGSLPAGISVSSAGVVSGTTSAATGNYPVTIRVTDSSTGPGSYFEVENYTLTVSPPPSVSIAVSPASVSEDGATNLTYTVTRSLNLSSPTVVNITTSGTATAGTDYTGSVATVTIPAGATTATITIDPTVDGTVEADETVTLTVAAGTGYTVGAPASATGTLLNDDVPTATISVSPTNVAEDGAPNLVYTVTLNQASFSALSIGYTIGGTATNGTDYATIASPLVIPAGSTTGTITVNPTADATIEANETVILTLNAGAGYTVGVPNSATGTILNDDLPNLAINDVTAAEGNAGTTNFTFTVSLSAPAGPGGVTFDIGTANGTATAGVDYVANSLTGQTIPAGSSTYTFTVQVNGDTLNEATETFFVNVTNVVNAVVVDGQGVGTISNDDPLPSLSIDDVAVTEGNSGTTNAVFTVTLNAASGQTVTVNYATADGTATQPADYTNTAGTLTFTPGQTTRTITVPVIGETIPEANETFFVNLSGATNATISDNQGVGTITNDDVPVTVSPGTLPNGTVATAYSQALSASGGVGPYSFSITAGALPAGLTLSSVGVLSGTPTAGGTFNFTVTATDSSPFPGPFSGSQAYTLTIAPPTITLPATTLADGNLGTSYSATISAASGGTAPYSYAVTAGALPGGLTLNASTGAITGTPSAHGTFNFSVTATDSSTGTGPYTATQAYALTVIDAPPVANPVSLTVAYNAPATNVPLNITGGAAVTVSEVVPSQHGTVITSGNTITYQPNPGYAGPDSFTYSATNGGGTSAPATVTITVQDPVITITPSGGFSATVGVPYTQTFTFNGGATPWSGFQVTSLPAGLSITGTTANTVTVSGMPTQVGSFNLNVSATDSSTGNGPYTVGQVFTLTVAAPTLTLTPASTTFNPTYGAAYSQAFSASGGAGPYTYAVTSGSLPPGLTLSAGTVSGAPTQPGNYVVQITATDAGTTGTGAPFTVQQSYTFNVPTPTILVGPATLANPVAGTAYAQTLTASGGAAPYGFAVTAGSLPAGITLSGSGALSGTSNQVGTYNFTVTATDHFGQIGNRAYSVTIAAPVLALTPASGTLVATYGTPFSQVFATVGGSGSASLVVTGTLPAGLAFSGGALSGTPTAPGSYPITVTATDTLLTGVGAPFTVSNSYTIDVPAPTITLAPATLPDTTAGLAYSQALSATGGVAPYTFAITAGSVPAGTTLSAGGVLSGTTTTSGTYSFTVTATDAFGQSGAQAYTVVVAVPTLTLTPATLPGAIAGTAYAQVLTVNGGIAPYTTTLTGTLPAGITFNAATRTFAGTPTQAGTFNLGVTVTDSTGGTAATVTSAYTLTVATPNLALTPSAGALPGGTAGSGYSQTFAASNGIAPYAYAVSAGALPAGLALNASTGTLSGTPTVAGSFGFSITATDSTTGSAGTVTHAYTLALSAPTIVVDPAMLPNGLLFVPYQQSMAGAGGTAPYTYAIATGALPTGVSLAANGVLSGTPNVAGAYAFTVQVTDALGFSGTRAYTVNINARPDPSQDPQIRGLIDAQQATSRRFAEAQTMNVLRRMETLHRQTDGPGFANQLSMSFTRACVPDLQNPDERGCAAMPVGGPSGTYDPGTAMPATANARERGGMGGRALGTWIGGSVRSGNVDARGGREALDFETDGVSAGVDYRFWPSLAAGAGVGYGRDRTDVGNDGARLDAKAKVAFLYASYHPGQVYYLDGMVGFQQLDYRMARTAIGGANLHGQRDGSQWFGSLTFSGEFGGDALLFSPYGRLDLARTALDGYAEQGDAVQALRYEDMDFDSNTGTLGLRVEFRRPTTWGVLQPQLRVEYQHDFSADSFALLQYADGFGPVYRADFTGFDRNRLVINLGSVFRTDNGWSTRLEYRGMYGSDGKDNGVSVNVEKAF